jgi:hypothetical protein
MASSRQMMSWATSAVLGHHVLSYCQTVIGMVVPYPITPPHCKQSAVWHRLVGSPNTVDVSCEWSTGSAQHCNLLSAHLASIMMHAHTSCRRLSNLRVCLRNTQAYLRNTRAYLCVLETHEPSCMPMQASPFFIPEAHGPLRAAGHMAASEPSRAGRWGPEPRDTWQCQNPPE